MTPIISKILSAATMLMHVGLLGILWSILQPATTISRWLQRHALKFAFLVALLATASSLYYSEVAGFEPCKLCWLQRIEMYPLVLLLGLALLRKNRDVVLHTILLASIGAIIAAMHVFLQWTGISLLPCAAIGQSVSCSKEFVHQFGYITIPVMSLTGFVVIIGLMLVARKSQPSTV